MPALVHPRPGPGLPTLSSSTTVLIEASPGFHSSRASGRNINKHQASSVKRRGSIFSKDGLSRTSSAQVSILTRDHVGDIEPESSGPVDHQRVIKKVVDVFETWDTWQQKILLCGLTNRCSTNQLESLATTMEPIFHRDFVLFHGKQYPASPFTNPTRVINRNPQPKEKHSATSRHSASSRRASGSETRRSSLRPKTRHLLQTPASKSLGSIQESTSENNISKTSNEVNRSTELFEKFNQAVGVFADDLSSNIISEVLEDNFKPPVTTVEGLAENLVDKVIKDAVETVNQAKAVKTEHISDEHELAKALGNVVLTDNKASHSSTANTASIRPKQKSRKRKQKKDPALQVYPEKSLPLAQTLSLKDVIHRELAKSQVLVREMSVVDLHLADKTFDRRLAAEHHNSLIVHDTSQRSRLGIASPASSVHKHSTSPLGRNTVAFIGTDMHGKSADCTGFWPQMNAIWEWISHWEDPQKLSLLSEIIKLCGSELVKYLTKCLMDRLRERLDISWLPDRLLLLVFSNLDVPDIETCAKVCRRWKHVTAMDELWMIKCLEFGQLEGVPDIVSRVTAASTRQQYSVDWRTAYHELQRITRDAKSALAKPNPVTQHEPSVPSIKASVISLQETSVDDSTSVTTEATELPLRRGTAAQLARESRRLKGLMSSSEEEDDWWDQREALSEGAVRLPRRPLSGATTDSTVLSLPRIAARGERDGRLSQSVGADGSHVIGSPISKRSSRLPRQPVHGSSTPPSRRKQTTIISSKSEGNLASHVISDAGKTSAGKTSAGKTSAGKSGIVNGGIGERAEDKAILEWIKGKRKSEDSGEIALDVRPELRQAQDILGKSAGRHLLRWRDNFHQHRRYAGQVPAVVKVRKFHGHMDAVLCIEFGPRKLISGSMDRSVRIWDVRSGRSIHKLYGHKGAVTCVKFEKSTLYTGSWDTSIMEWDLVTFERRAVLTGHSGTVSCMAMDHRYLISGSHDSSVRVWSRDSRVCEKVLDMHQSHVVGLYFDGMSIITGSSDRTVRLTNVLTTLSKKLVTGHPEPIHQILVEGSLIITASLSGRVYFWSRKTGGPQAAIQAHDAAINALAFHRGRFFTAAVDQTVKEWDLVTLTCVRLLQGHKGPIRDFKVSDKRMVSCSTDGQIRVWDLDLPEEKLAEVSDDTIPYEVIKQRDIGGQVNKGQVSQGH